MQYFHNVSRDAIQLLINKAMLKSFHCYTFVFNLVMYSTGQVARKEISLFVINCPRLPFSGSMQHPEGFPDVYFKGNCYYCHNCVHS